MTPSLVRSTSNKHRQLVGDLARPRQLTIASSCPEIIRPQTYMSECSKVLTGCEYVVCLLTPCSLKIKPHIAFNIDYFRLSELCPYPATYFGFLCLYPFLSWKCHCHGLSHLFFLSVNVCKVLFVPGLRGRAPEKPTFNGWR